MKVSLMDNLYGKVFAKSDTCKTILILDTTRECLRIKQRSRMLNGDKCKQLKFISYKEMNDYRNKSNYDVIDKINFYNKSKL